LYSKITSIDPAQSCFFAVMYTEVVSVYIGVFLLANKGIVTKVSKTSHTITHRLRVFETPLRRLCHSAIAPVPSAFAGHAVQGIGGVDRMLTRTL
jgi:hypothetical protein